MENEDTRMLLPLAIHYPTFGNICFEMTDHGILVVRKQLYIIQMDKYGSADHHEESGIV